MRERHLRVLAHVQTLAMTPGLPDPAGIAEARTLAGNPQHNGALQFRGLPYALSRLGTAHVGRWGGRSQPREKPRSTRNQFLIFCIFCVFFKARGDYIKGKGCANSLGSPMWDYSHMGGRPMQGPPTPSGPHGPAAPLSWGELPFLGL